jgi:hypothetical protein
VAVVVALWLWWLWGYGCVYGAMCYSDGCGAVCVLWWPMVVAVVLCSMCWPSIRCYVPTIHPMQWGPLYIGANMGAYIGVKCAPFSLGVLISDVLGSFGGCVMGLNRDVYGLL